VAKEETIRVTGQVVELLPNATFRVRIDEMNSVIMAYLGGKLRQHSINILLGDNVVLEMSPYDLSKGRVVYRK
jgi:translation initiation factor IF-1